MVKRIFVFFLVIMMSCSLVACSNNNISSENTNTDNSIQQPMTTTATMTIIGIYDIAITYDNILVSEFNGNLDDLKALVYWDKEDNVTASLKFNDDIYPIDYYTANDYLTKEMENLTNDDTLKVINTSEVKVIDVNGIKFHYVESSYQLENDDFVYSNVDFAFNVTDDLVITGIISVDDDDNGLFDITKVVEAMLKDITLTTIE